MGLEIWSADRRVVENRRSKLSFPTRNDDCVLNSYIRHGFNRALSRNEKSRKSGKIDGAIRRSFGVGNSTGLGMAPFLINHPRLIHNWFEAKKTPSQQ